MPHQQQKKKEEYGGPIQIGACPYEATIFTVTIRAYRTCDCARMCDMSKATGCPYVNNIQKAA